MTIPRLALITLGLMAPPTLLAAGGPPARPGAGAPDRTVRTDAQGDPLPPGAVARLGTLRWRQACQSFAFSPDGRYFAAAGPSTRVFDAASGKLMRSLAAPSTFLFFHPDRKTLLTTPNRFGQVVCFWDLDAGKERRQVRVTGGGNFYPSWSADGKLMVAYEYRLEGGKRPQKGKGPVVTFWDMDSGKEIHTWVNPLGRLSLNQIALAPDGKTVALREQSRIHLFDVESGKELRSLASPIGNGGQTIATRIMSFSADGKLLACTENGSVRVWETATGRGVQRFTLRGDRAVSVALSPDARYLAAGGARGSVYLWDRAARRLLHTLAASHSNMPVYLLAFSPDGKRLASQAHLVQSIRLWDVASGREEPSAEAPATPVAGLAFGPDGKTVVSADSEGSVWLWDAASGKLGRRFPGKAVLGLNQPQPVAILPGGKTLVRGAYESEVLTWDVASGELLQRGLNVGAVPAPGSPPGAELYPECSPDGRTVVAVFPGALKRQVEFKAGGRPPPPPMMIHWTMIGLWDARTGKMTRSFRVDAENLRRVTLSPDGRLLAGVGRLPEDLQKTFAFVWDLARGRELRRFEIPSIDGWNGITFSADGRTLFGGPHRATENPKAIRFCFWEVATGRQRAAAECALPMPYTPLTVFAGEHLVALATEAKVYLVDPLTGKELRQLEGHEGRVERLAFSPDASRLTTGSHDTTALVWDLSGVVPAEKKVQLSAKELEDRWAELAGDDAERAYRAVRLLARAPGQAVPLIAKHLRPVPFPQREQVRRLLAALDSKQFAEREKATEELGQLGPAAEAALRQLLEGQPSLEVRRRVEGILAKAKEAEAKPPPVPTGEALRALRALEVLERAGTEEAVRLLSRLSDGAPHDPFTREARALWLRLSKRAATSR